MATPEWNLMWKLIDTFDVKELLAIQKILKYIYEQAGTEDNSTGMQEALEAERQLRAINIAVKETLGYL